MASIVQVLVIPLIVLLVVWPIVLVATSRLAKREGLALKSVSISLHHGITAKFHKPGSKSGHNRN